MRLQHELLNETLQLLSSEPRRDILYVLTESDETTLSYDEIVDTLAGEGYLRDDAKERFKVSMAHNYLPRLEEGGLISQDQRSEEVRYIEDAQVEGLLEDIQEYEE